MTVRKRIGDVVLPTVRAHSQHPQIIMGIMEDRLIDVFRLFHDKMAFKKKLAVKTDQQLTIKQDFSVIEISQDNSAYG